ncbi:hypothetical protein [Nocardioides flavescens]|uniref:Uncharacterized protein n=1 Tax=Nocardioides flavescens TaxID=2691959 RepID=A0A6L7EXX6_9ACTN|nr:hypothetical protein [Nocardioides flavescens]MXG90408.1 hypothetical protein [Nocardioides flavescens]
MTVPLVALFWGGMMWLSFRRRWQRYCADSPVADATRPGGKRRGRARGLITSATVALGLLLVVGFFRLVGWGDESTPGLMLGIFLGLAVWSALHRRDLRSWEAEHALAVWSRAGARRIAWTSTQAQNRLVLVRRSS